MPGCMSSNVLIADTRMPTFDRRPDRRCPPERRRGLDAGPGLVLVVPATTWLGETEDLRRYARWFLETFRPPTPGGMIVGS